MARRRTARTLLADLAARGIVVQLEGLDLELSGPVDELPPALLEEVRGAKPAIVRLLRVTSASERQAGPGAGSAVALPEPPPADADAPDGSNDEAILAGAEDGIAAAEVLPEGEPDAATVAAAEGASYGPAAEPNPYRGRILRHIRRRAPVA
ncbi:MAG: hypothetical protein EPN50_04730 [Chloroflexota bacterium]|nr:MAG: hypothetical protein EPN50_04730 [Chloroflexota bacterium]